MPFFGGDDGSSSDDEYKNPKAGRVVPLSKKKDSTKPAPKVVAVVPSPAQAVAPVAPVPQQQQPAPPAPDDEFGFSTLIDDAQQKKLKAAQGRWGGSAAPGSGSQLLGAMSEAANIRAEERTIRQIQQNKKERLEESEKDQSLASRDLEVGTFVTKRYQAKINELQRKHGRSLFDQAEEQRNKEKSAAVTGGSKFGAKKTLFDADDEEDGDYYNQLNNLEARNKKAALDNKNNNTKKPADENSAGGVSAKSLMELLGGDSEADDVPPPSVVLPSSPVAAASSHQSADPPRGEEGEQEGEMDAAAETAQHLGEELKRREATLNEAKAERRKARMYQSLPDAYIHAQLKVLKKVERERETAIVNYLVSM